MMRTRTAEPAATKKTYATIITYPNNKVNVYLCDTELSAQKRMLSAVADSYYNFVYERGFRASFEISDDIMSATMETDPGDGKRVTTAFCVGKVLA